MQITASKLDRPSAVSFRMFATENGTLSPLFKASERALWTGPGGYVASLDVEAFHREPQRLSPYATGTIQHPNRLSVTTFMLEDSAKHRCLSDNACFPAFKYVVVVSSKFVVSLRGIGHDAF